MQHPAPVLDYYDAPMDWPFGSMTLRIAYRAYPVPIENRHPAPRLFDAEIDLVSAMIREQSFDRDLRRWRPRGGWKDASALFDFFSDELVATIKDEIASVERSMWNIGGD